jgi:RsiW-degrading membrane proteinase PrsW (M82 family)
MILILIYLVITIIAISVCYFDAKKYHHTMKFFLEECLLVTFLFPITLIFLVSRLMEFFKINLPEFKINTDFITKFLNKKL